jgi:osmotically-inducible protein OsmY
MIAGEMMNDADGTRIAIGMAGKAMVEADGAETKVGPGPIMRGLSRKRTMTALAMARITTEGSAKAVMVRATAEVDSSGNIIATAVTAVDMVGKPGAAAVREKAKAGRPAAMTPVTAAAADNQRSWWDRASDEVSSWMGDEEAERRRRMDYARGGHYGKGPRGYTRSDDRIREDVHDRLTDDWMLDATNITVTVNGGEITLDGTVNNREDKRRAEDLTENVSGVRHVQNNLRVQQQGSETSASISAARSSSGASTARSTR